MEEVGVRMHIHNTFLDLKLQVPQSILCGNQGPMIGWSTLPFLFTLVADSSLRSLIKEYLEDYLGVFPLDQREWWYPIYSMRMTLLSLSMANEQAFGI